MVSTLFDAMPTRLAPPRPFLTPAEHPGPQVNLLHPWTGYADENVLLSLPAVDSFDGTRRGLHYRTLLTAGAIIANNAFDRVYLTRDQAGTQRVEGPVGVMDGILEPGDYWLHLEGNGPGEPQSREGQGQSVDVLGAMPPPVNPRPSSPLLRSQPSTTPSSPPPVEEYPYPVVASFQDWQFPHGRLPLEWKCSNDAPGPQAFECCISGYRTQVDSCHMIPVSQKGWFNQNRMSRYISYAPKWVNDVANMALMRSDIHGLFDKHSFVIIPKPTTSRTQDAEPYSYAFATHVLRTDDECGELHDLYHNATLQPSGCTAKPEFLFARFAWSLFSHFRPFLYSRKNRFLLIRDAKLPCNLWMNNNEWSIFQARRGKSRYESRKRSSSQMTRDEADLELDDTYQDRWERRNFSLQSASLNDAIQENTRWYEEVGRYVGARGCTPTEVAIQGNTRWYEEAGRHAGAYSRTPIEVAIAENTRWYNEVGRYAELAEDTDSYSEGTVYERYLS